MLHPGTSVAETLVLSNVTIVLEKKTSIDQMPEPAKRCPLPLTVPINFLLLNIDEKSYGSFVINRKADSCCTPRRNDSVDDAWQYFLSGVAPWCAAVCAYLDGKEDTAPKERNELQISPSLVTSMTQGTLAIQVIADIYSQH